MTSHQHYSGNDGFTCPFDPKDFRQLLEIMRRGFSDREDSITQPTHAEVAKLLIEEFNTKLAGEERNIFDDGQSDSPLFILGKLHDCGQ